MKNPKMRASVYLISVLSALLYAPSVLAETLIPKHVQYDVEVKQDALAKSCNLMLMIINNPAPEVVNTRLIAVAVKDTLSFYALSIDVGDTIFVNGLPSKILKAPLKTASFDSTSFSSAGRLNGGATEDGGIMLRTCSLSFSQKL